jgi:hypothetical protein
VNPLSTSVFDLPNHLARKPDPTLVACDEEHFAAIAESLEQLFAGLSDRLEGVRKAPGGIGQQALERDAEIHRLTARLRILRRYSLDLCLSRMVHTDNREPVLIGRLGLTDHAGCRLLLDWRSPAAEPFFGFAAFVDGDRSQACSCLVQGRLRSASHGIRYSGTAMMTRPP